MVLFVIRKTGAGGTCSLLDCHVFAVRRESIAFELCDMIRKLIIKRTMSPILSKSHGSGTTLLRVHDHDQKHTTMEKRTKYFDRDRPISAMEHRHGDIPIAIDRKVIDLKTKDMIRQRISFYISLFLSLEYTFRFHNNDQ